MDIWSSWIWPLATAILGFVYVGLLVAQYLKRRKIHQLMWAIGFMFYAVAAVMEFWSEYTLAWDPTVYRIYIVLAASLVGFLGNGTLYLITKKRIWGDAYLVFNLLAVAVFLYGTFTAQLNMANLVPGITVGGKALGDSLSFPRVMSFAFNIPGSLLLLGGSAWSVVKFWGKKAFRYRAWGKRPDLHRHAADRARRFDGADGNDRGPVSGRDGRLGGSALGLPRRGDVGQGRAGGQDRARDSARSGRVRPSAG